MKPNAQTKTRKRVISTNRSRHNIAKSYGRNQRDCSPNTTTHQKIMIEEKAPKSTSSKIEVIIGVGHNKFYKKAVADNSLLPIEQFPLGFFLKFSLDRPESLAYFQETFEYLFQNENTPSENPNAYLNIRQFKKNYFPFFYFKNPTYMRTYLKKIQKNVVFYSTNKLGKQVLAITDIYEKAEVAFQKIKAT